MTTTVINGRDVYCLTRHDVEGCELTPFAKAAETWIEGKNKGSLSVQELNNIKQRYKNADDMSVPDAIQTFGDMVEAGLMTISEAGFTWYGVTPMTPEELQNTTGFLTKRDPETAVKQTGWGTKLARKEAELIEGRNGESLLAAANVGGMDSYRCLYELLQNVKTDMQDAKGFQMCDTEAYMDIWNQMLG